MLRRPQLGCLHRRTNQDLSLGKWCGCSVTRRGHRRRFLALRDRSLRHARRSQEAELFSVFNFFIGPGNLYTAQSRTLKKPKHDCLVVGWRFEGLVSPLCEPSTSLHTDLHFGPQNNGKAPGAFLSSNSEKLCCFQTRLERQE